MSLQQPLKKVEEVDVVYMSHYCQVHSTPAITHQSTSKHIKSTSKAHQRHIKAHKKHIKNT